MKEDDEKIVPTDEDENVGGEPPKKKKEKKKKSKEERSADRKVIFWVLLAMILVTGIFYFYPILKGQKLPDLNNLNNNKTEEGVDGGFDVPGWKGYSEVNF